MQIEKEKLGVVLLYFFSSVFTTLASKEIVNSFGFPWHYLLISIQCTVISLIILGYSFFYRPLKFRNIQKWFLTSVFLSLMMVSNIKAIFYFQVSLFTLYKNCSIILVAVLELYLFQKEISIIGYASFLMMIMSSYTANIKDHIEPVGYLWMGMNIVATSAYVLYLKFVMIHRGSKIEATFFTNLIGIPIMSFFSFFLDDYSNQISISPGLVFWIALSSIGALLTAFSTAWTLKVLSSTALCMLGATNKLFLSISGILWFSESIHLIKIVSLLIGIAGGALFSYDSIKKSTEQN